MIQYIIKIITDAKEISGPIFYNAIVSGFVPNTVTSPEDITAPTAFSCADAIQVKFTRVALTLNSGDHGVIRFNGATSTQYEQPLAKSTACADNYVVVPDVGYRFIGYKESAESSTYITDLSAFVVEKDTILTAYYVEKDEVTGDKLKGNLPENM